MLCRRGAIPRSLVATRPEVDRGLGLIGLDMAVSASITVASLRCTSSNLALWLSRQAWRSARKTCRRLVGVRNGPHATEGACPVVERVRCHRDLGLFKRHTPAFKPGEGQELMHG